ncbi:hypothetical protein VNO80_02002 [Phaseolus coccineus]|uniref:Uncharacterized protein n=1 Tax=Phaseolus coccineus TaxID=3886 RepID=A0AAN9RTC8_PHACN
MSTNALNAIMTRDDGNTLHPCLINSCCILKVDMEGHFFSIHFIPFFGRGGGSGCLRYTVPMAIALSAQLLLGQPVMVNPSEAEKNIVQSNTTSKLLG